MSSSRSRGDRNPSWLVLRRGLAIIRRLMRSPATKAELLTAVRTAVGPDAYSESASAAERALKNDRAVLRDKLGVEIVYDRSKGVYWLANLGDLPWLDLTDDDLAAIVTIYNSFVGAHPEAERVRAFLDRIGSLMPPERRQAVQAQRVSLTVQWRELDETPVPERVQQVLHRAITQRHRVGFNYRAATTGARVRYHEVEPYGIVLRDGHYYLECFDLFSRGADNDQTPHHQHRRLRLLGIVDDEMLRVLPERLPPGRRPQRSYLVKYRLAPPAVHHGVSRHFADMHVEKQVDGSAIVTATTYDPWEAVRILLHYGDSCVVLGGPELLREMRRVVVGMAKNYDVLVYEMT